MAVGEKNSTGGLLLRHDENVGISKAMVNGLVPI